MSVVEEQLRLGDDALANQFIVEFPSGIPGGGNADAIKLRLTQPFDPPQQITMLYNIDYKGDIIRKTSRKTETAKEFTLTVRIDQLWTVYDDLARWNKLTFDPINNNAMSESDTRAPVVIQSIGNNNEIVKNLKYTQCKLYGMKVTSFDPTTGDPLYAELNFIYGDFDDGVTI